MNGTPTPIIVTDLRIPFIRLVLFFVKVTLAAIPAAIIVGVVVAAIAAVIGAMFGIQHDWMMQRWRL